MHSFFVHCLQTFLHVFHFTFPAFPNFLFWSLLSLLRLSSLALFPIPSWGPSLQAGLWVLQQPPVGVGALPKMPFRAWETAGQTFWLHTHCLLGCSVPLLLLWISIRIPRAPWSTSSCLHLLLPSFLPIAPINKHFFFSFGLYQLISSSADGTVWILKSRIFKPCQQGCRLYLIHYWWFQSLLLEVTSQQTYSVETNTEACFVMLNDTEVDGLLQEIPAK